MLGSSVNDARGSFVAGDVLAPVLNHSTIAQRSAGKTKLTKNELRDKDTAPQTVRVPVRRNYRVFH